MKRITLDNGLTIFFRRTPGTRTVAIDTWVKAGAADEPCELSGISHFLEHMLFKGTERYEPGEIDKIVESVGAVWNAETSEDYTRFYISVAAPYFNKCLEVMAEVIRHSIVDPAECEKERLVILEEFSRKQDNPGGFLLEEIYKKSFIKGPYKQSVLGEPATIKNITRDNIEEYYRRYYTPDNMIIVIVGDIEEAEVVEQATARFGDFENRKKPFPVDEEYEYATGQREIYTRQAGDTYLSLAFPAPGIDKFGDVLALDVLSVILGEGHSSRLFRKIREDQHLVSSIGVSYGTTRLDGLLMILATLNSDNMDKAEESIREEITRIREEPVAAGELRKAVRVLTNSHYFATETNAGQAGIFGYYYIISDSDTIERRYIDRLPEVTAGDVRDVARKYLSPATYNLFAIQPEDSS